MAHLDIIVAPTQIFYNPMEKFNKEQGSSDGDGAVRILQQFCSHLRYLVQTNLDICLF